MFPSVVVHVVLSHSYREARVSDIRRVLSASCALHGADAALYLCGLGDSRNDAANANGSNHRRIVRHSIGILDWAAMPLIPDKRQKAHDCETKAMHVRVVASTLAYRCAPTFGICCLRSTLNHPQPDASGCSREGAWPSWRRLPRLGTPAIAGGEPQPSWMEGCSAASGSVCTWYVAAAVAACCKKMKLQGFLISVSPSFAGCSV